MTRRFSCVGDFDADGATAVALAVSLLRALGAGRVDYLVPNRFEFGYGLSPEIVALAAERRPQLLITVDNGVSSVAGVGPPRPRAWT
jgi:single-stranded-DNA-specific exonuclease